MSQPNPVLAVEATGLRSLPRRVRIGRFLLVAQMVGRIYGGYKLIQTYGRLISRSGLSQRYARHHRRSAELVYRTAVRLEGLLIPTVAFKVSAVLGNTKAWPQHQRECL